MSELRISERLAEDLMRALDCPDVFGHRDEIHEWFAHWDSIDNAWAEVEVELPKGWRLHLLEATASGEWRAVAGVREDDGSNPFIAIEIGPTPAAALRALAEKLRERAA